MIIWLNARFIRLVKILIASQGRGVLRFQRRLMTSFCAGSRSSFVGKLHVTSGVYINAKNRKAMTCIFVLDDGALFSIYFEGTGAQYYIKDLSENVVVVKVGRLRLD